MHHIDRTLQELETGSGINGEYETGYEFSANGEFGQAFEQSFGQEANYENYETFELEQDPELEMAYQLLEINNEYELNQFLGGLMSKALGTAKTAATNFINSPAGKGVGQYLVNFGRKTIPTLAAKAGGAAINYAASKGYDRATPEQVQLAQTYAGHYVGAPIGNFIANQAERIFGLEPKKLDQKNQELEIARSFVRFASDLTRQASQAVRQNPTISLSELGKQAIAASAKQHAPGLLANTQPSGIMNGKSGGGNWVRRGNAILVYGA